MSGDGERNMAPGKGAELGIETLLESVECRLFCSVGSDLDARYGVASPKLKVIPEMRKAR